MSETSHPTRDRCADLIRLLHVVLWEAQLDREGTLRVDHVDPAAATVLGEPAEHWLDESAWRALVHSEDWPRVEQARLSAARDGVRGDTEFLARAADGRELVLREVVEPDPDTPGRISAAIRDVTADSRAARTQATAYRDLMEQAPDAILVLDQDGVIHHANAYATRVMRAGDLTGRNVAEWLDPEELAREPLGSGLRMGHTVSRERRLVLEDGTRVAVEIRARPLQDGLVQAIVRDLTERRRVEAALRDSETRFRALFENSPVGMTLTGPDTRVLDCNPAFAEMVGRSREEVRGTSFREVTHPDDLAANEAYFQAMLSGECDRYTLEKRYLHPDGRTIWARLVSSAVREADGSLRYQATLVEDVTAARAAVDALQASEQLFQEFASNVDEVFWISQPDGALLYVSPAYERIWGRPLETLLRHPESFAEAVHPDDRHRVDHDSFARAAGGALEYRIVRPDGEVRWIRDRVFAMRDAAGEQVRLMGVAEDVTERTRLEEQLHRSQKLEAVGKLAGGIAHDFNNLLTSISGNAELMMMDLAAGDPMREDAAEIVRAAGRAAELTRQLLAFSRQQVLQLRVLDLNLAVQEMQRMLRRLIESSVELRVELAPQAAWVRGDPGQLEQVVLNLVVNARDATSAGGRITVVTSRCTVVSDDPDVPGYVQPGEYVRLEVVDTGTGMDAATLERLFEPFFTTKEPGKGTGLGLSTVYGIVKQSGGFVWAESTPGAGSRFVVLLPCSSEAFEAATPGAEPAADTGPAVVLVVDDEPAVRALAGRALAASGFTVLEAGSVSEGLRLARAAPRLDLLLADVVMPEGGGPALADALLAERPRVAVLFMSGYVGMVAGRLPAGAELVNKPFSPAALAERVRATLARAQPGG